MIFVVGLILAGFGLGVIALWFFGSLLVPLVPYPEELEGKLRWVLLAGVAALVVGGGIVTSTP